MITNSSLNELFKGFKSAYMKNFLTNTKDFFRFDDLRGKHFDYIIMDEINETTEQVAKIARHSAAYGKPLEFKIDKKMLVDNLYGQFLNYFKNKMEYLDPSGLSKKELIEIIMLMQGLIDGLMWQKQEQNRIIGGLSKEIEITRQNEQFAKRNGETAGRVFEKVVEILADKLKEDND